MSAEPVSKRELHKQRRDEQRRLEEQGAKARRRKTLLIGVAAGALLVVLVALAATTLPRGAAPPAAPAGTRDVAVEGRNHVETAVAYLTVPAAGGPHAPVWQNCGFYEQAVANENAVHSLEHSAVWIAYDPALPEAQRQSLRELVAGRGFVLASPLDGLGTPLAASAWGKLFEADGPDDPDLAAFVQAFENGPQTPEPGAPCSGGLGEPST